MSEQTRQYTPVIGSRSPPLNSDHLSLPIFLLLCSRSFFSFGNVSELPIGRRSIDSLAKCPCRIIFRQMEHKSWAAKLNFVFLHYCSWAIELARPTGEEDRGGEREDGSKMKGSRRRFGRNFRIMKEIIEKVGRRKRLHFSRQKTMLTGEEPASSSTRILWQCLMRGRREWFS